MIQPPLLFHGPICLGVQRAAQYRILGVRRGGDQHADLLPHHGTLAGVAASSRLSHSGSQLDCGRRSHLL